MNDNVIGISAELSKSELSPIMERDEDSSYQVNVFLDPFQRETLVQQSGIQSTILLDLLACEKTESTNPVIEIDQDNVLVGFGDHIRTIVIGIRVCSIAAALDVKPDFELGSLGRVGGCEDIDIQTILAQATTDGLAIANTSRLKLFDINTPS
jgi:hypothetical protein